jgi:sortase A
MMKAQRRQPEATMTTSRKLMWTLGNFLMLIGLYLLLFVGGFIADERYNIYAARGDNEEFAPVIVSRGDSSADAPIATTSSDNEEDAPISAATETPSIQQTPQPTRAPATPTPTPSNLPGPSNSSSELTNAIPTKAVDHGPSTITRIVIPSILVDRKVVEIGWTTQQDENGQTVAVWEVDQYRVGHHKGSSNPGGGGNIVLSGHSGGTAYPFNDLYYLNPGQLVQLYSNGQIYDYIVSEHIIVDEVGQPLEKRLENARYIEPTDEEMVTMIACWPLVGPDRFKQRIIIRAKPAGAPSDPTPTTP